MDENGWLREEVDERLEGLFVEHPEFLQKTLRDLLEQSNIDPEIEELLVETLETGVFEANDETMGLTWICVLLGELRSTRGVGALMHALASADEDLVSGATRALRRIGETAFEVILERIDEDEVPPDLYVILVQVLEGVRLHAFEDLRDRVQETLLHHLRVDTHRWLANGAEVSRSALVRRIESAALALARLGVAQAREVVEDAWVQVCDHSNSFVREALDIFEESPDGIPCTAESSWEEEYRWALGPELPGGEIPWPEEAEEGSSSEAPPPPRRF